MKGKIIARIVIYCLIIVLLSSVLITVLAGRSYFFGFRKSTGKEMNTSAAPSGVPVVMSTDGIHSIQIDWAAGSITLKPYDVDGIQIIETRSQNQEPMSVTEKSGTLHVSYQKEGNFGGIKELHGKDLSILIPKDWSFRELTVDAASAELLIQDAVVGQVAVNTASGESQALDCSFDKLEINTASGDVTFRGTLLEFSCDAASASADLTILNQPRKIEVDAISGDICLTLPKDCGFTVDRESLSGRTECDFPVVNDGKHFSYGSGSCRIEIDGVSGDLTLRQGNEHAHEHSHH